MRTSSGFALIAVSAATLLLACSSAPTSTDKSDTSNESDAIAFSTSWKVLGSLDYGQTSDSFNYKNPPKYRAYKFAGAAGDAVDVWARSSNGGDAVAWVLDNDLHVVGHNDDAADGGTLDSHITVKLPANASATHYVVVRDYNLANAAFTVALNGTPAVASWLSCNVDADCVAVPQVACCHNGREAAVNKHHITAYQNSFTCPTPHPFCPLYVMLDTRQPECNNDSHTCEMVAITDIACDAHSANSHACPAGYDCDAPGTDAPGKCTQPPACVETQMCTRTSHWDSTTCGCVANPSCGGFAGLTCPAGYSSCIDDPTDSCNPASGGADCSGICVN